MLRVLQRCAERSAGRGDRVDTVVVDNAWRPLRSPTTVAGLHSIVHILHAARAARRRGDERRGRPRAQMACCGENREEVAQRSAAAVRCRQWRRGMQFSSGCVHSVGCVARKVFA